MLVNIALKILSFLSRQEGGPKRRVRVRGKSRKTRAELQTGHRICRNQEVRIDALSLAQL